MKKPLIHQGRNISEEELLQGRGVLDTRSDVLIQVIEESQDDTIIDVRLGYSDCETHKKESIKTLLDQWEK